jgi:hypothetical protein
MLTGVHIPHLLTVRIRTLAVTAQVALNLHLRKETSPTTTRLLQSTAGEAREVLRQFLYVLAIF